MVKRELTPNLKVQPQSNLDFIINYRKVIWVIGFFIRFFASSLKLDNWDYIAWRLPVAKGVSSGYGLYNDVAYNHMPIYPYMSGLMILLVDTDNEILTAMAIKFPQVIFDSLIPLIIYKLGLYYGNERDGALASIFYALNPITINEISNATFHSIASFFILLSFYLMLNDKEYLSGIFISLGFLTSQYPIVMLAIVTIYWRNSPLKIFKSVISFILVTIVILFLVLYPFGTSLTTMLDNLGGNPTYQNQGEQLPIGQCPRESYVIIHENYNISYITLSMIWLLIFVSTGLTTSYYYFRNTNDLTSLHTVVIYLVMLSVFFNCIHTKYVVWLIPFLLYWD